MKQKYDKLKLDTLVEYLGEFEHCHGFVYKVIKNYDNRWVDLELINSHLKKESYLGPYNEIMSVFHTDIKKICESYKEDY